MEDLIKIAEGGDGKAMHLVGCSYEFGSSGLKQDRKMGFQWFKRSHAARCVAGTACVGQAYLLGFGVAINHKEAWIVVHNNGSSPRIQCGS